MNSRTKNLIIGVVATIGILSLFGALWLEYHGKSASAILWAIPSSIVAGLLGLFQHGASTSQQDKVLGDKITNVEKPEQE